MRADVSELQRDLPHGAVDSIISFRAMVIQRQWEHEAGAMEFLAKPFRDEDC